MGEIEKSYRQTLSSLKKGFESDPVLKNYLEASKEFDLLVKKGLTQKRGNNLRSAADFHLAGTGFQVK
jgi:hypothetical protein